MDSCFDSEMLLTYSGATLAVTLITQFLKGVRWLDRLPTRVISYLLALVIMLGAGFAHGFSCWQEAALIPVNAVVVALAANGSFDALSDRGKKSAPSHGEYADEGADEHERRA